jgi:ankyrin repeat protein|tara:strand:+ start:26 stop:682 length:657 start_codon:yes stop_codon:yes gene_type:complete
MGHTKRYLLLVDGLIEAIADNNLNNAKYYINKGANPNVIMPNELEFPGLSVAAENGNIDLVKLMLKNGADVSLDDLHNNTSLMLLLACNMVSINEENTLSPNFKIITKLLLDNEQDLNIISNTNGLTPLIMSIFIHELWLVEEMLAHGADPNYYNKNITNTPLHFAAEYNDVNIMKLLIKNGAEKDALNSKGLTPWSLVITKYNLPVNKAAEIMDIFS